MLSKGVTMFISLQTEQLNIIKVNTSQIAWIDGEKVTMSNGLTIALAEKAVKELEESLYGPASEASPAASEHTSNLLNELSKLCGGRGDAKPTSDRKARLKTRLKDFSEDDLKLAATNLGNDEFMQGANDNGKRYGTIDYLLRTSANVNKWLEEQPQKKKGMF